MQEYPPTKSITIRAIRSLTTAIKGFNFGGGVSNAGYGGSNGSLPIRMVSGAEFNDVWLGTEELNYTKMLGNVWDASIMSIILNWFWRTFTEAPCIVQHRNADDRWETEHDHPLASLLNHPHDFFTPSQLWDMILLGYNLNGNAYVFKDRFQATDEVANLIPIPHWQIEPAWNDEEYISYYRYTPDPTKPDDFQKLATRDIIHFKNGFDPANWRKGLAPWRASMRQLVTDKEVDIFESTIVHNRGVPSVIIMPADNTTYIGKDDADRIKTTYVARTTGKERGKPLVFSDPYKLQELGMNPQQLMIDKLRQIPETRLAAEYGIPAAILGLLAGVENSTLANVKTWWEYSYQSGIMPLQRRLAETLTHYLLTDYEAAGIGTIWRVSFDVSEVYALQGQRNDLHQRVDADFRAGVVRRNECRVKIGLKPVDGGDVFIEEVLPQQIGFGSASSPDTGHSDAVAGDSSGTQPTNGTHGGDGLPTSQKAVRELIGSIR